MVEHVDLFVAPARYLSDRYRDEFGLPRRKLRLPRLRLRPRPPRGRSRARRALHLRLHRHAHPREGHPPAHRGLRPREGRRSPAHLGPPSRPGHRALRRPSRTRSPTARRARRVAAGVPQPGDRPRRLRPRRRHRRPLGLGRELAARDPRGPAARVPGDHRRRRRHGRVRPPRGQRPPLRAPRSRRARRQMQRLVDDPALAARSARGVYSIPGRHPGRRRTTSPRSRAIYADSLGAATPPA
jgi:hypothetical protein